MIDPAKLSLWKRLSEEATPGPWAKELVYGWGPLVHQGFGCRCTRPS